MSVRKAEYGDVLGMIEMGRAMHDASPRYRKMGWDDEKVRGQLCSCVSSGCCWVADAGFFAGGITRTFFGPDLYAFDYALWIEPGERGNGDAGLLLDAFEAWAAWAGAVETVLGVSAGIHDERALALYYSRGYTQVGVSVRKAISRAA